MPFLLTYYITALIVSLIYPENINVLTYGILVLLMGLFIEIIRLEPNWSLKSNINMILSSVILSGIYTSIFYSNPLQVNNILTPECYSFIMFSVSLMYYFSFICFLIVLVFILKKITKIKVK